MNCFCQEDMIPRGSWSKKPVRFSAARLEITPLSFPLTSQKEFIPVTPVISFPQSCHTHHQESQTGGPFPLCPPTWSMRCAPGKEKERKAAIHIISRLLSITPIPKYSTRTPGQEGGGWAPLSLGRIWTRYKMQNLTRIKKQNQRPKTSTDWIRCNKTCRAGVGSSFVL